MAIVERERVGGECDCWACIPSKTLLRPGEALQAAREAPGAREAVSGGVRPEGAFEGRDFMVSGYQDGATVEYLASKGIEVLRGAARLAGAGRVEIDYLGEHASRVRRDGDEYVLEFEGRDELRADRLLVATGRRPRADGLGLESVGVEPTRRGIPVDERMRVTEGVRAIGDVTGVWPLTYMGKYQGRVAAANILGRERRANYDAVPRVVFTDPQAAAAARAMGPSRPPCRSRRCLERPHTHARTRTARASSHSSPTAGG